MALDRAKKPRRSLQNLTILHYLTEPFTRLTRSGNSRKKDFVRLSARSLARQLLVANIKLLHNTFGGMIHEE